MEKLNKTYANRSRTRYLTVCDILSKITLENKIMQNICCYGEYIAGHVAEHEPTIVPASTR